MNKLPFGITVSSIINSTEGVEFDYSEHYFRKKNIGLKEVLIFKFLETPDDRIVKSIIFGVGNTKLIQEERDSQTKKLVAITTHEVNDNNQLVSVKFYEILF